MDTSQYRVEVRLMLRDITWLPSLQANAPCLRLAAALVHVWTERHGAPQHRRLRGAAEGPGGDGPPVGSEHAAGGLRPHAAADWHRNQGSDEDRLECLHCSFLQGALFKEPKQNQKLSCYGPWNESRWDVLMWQCLWLDSLELNSQTLIPGTWPQFMTVSRPAHLTKDEQLLSQSIVFGRNASLLTGAVVPIGSQDPGWDWKIKSTNDGVVPLMATAMSGSNSENQRQISWKVTF